MKNLITNGFMNEDDDVLVLKAKFIFDQMTANASIFTKPDPPLADLKALADEYEQAVLDAKTRDLYKIRAAADKKRQLADFLQTLGLYVNLVANGSRTIAMLSGFDIRKESTTRVLVTPDAPKANRGAKLTTIEAVCASQDAASVYAWYITQDPSLPRSQWTLVQGQRTKVVFEGCIPGVTYYVVVEVYGSNKQQAVSPVATVVA